MKNLKYYIEKAEKENFAIGQFNFSDLNRMQAIALASKNLNSPLLNAIN